MITPTFNISEIVADQTPDLSTLHKLHVEMGMIHLYPVILGVTKQ